LPASRHNRGEPPRPQFPFSSVLLSSLLSSVIARHDEPLRSKSRKRFPPRPSPGAPAHFSQFRDNPPCVDTIVLTPFFPHSSLVAPLSGSSCCPLTVKAHVLTSISVFREFSLLSSLFRYFFFLFLTPEISEWFCFPSRVLSFFSRCF